jgi:hypothetical protein
VAMGRVTITRAGIQVSGPGAEGLQVSVPLPCDRLLCLSTRGLGEHGYRTVVTLRARWVTLRARWVTLRARWVTLRARWVTRRALWVTIRARWVTLRARWVTLRARWVTLRALGDAESSLGDAKSSLGDVQDGGDNGASTNPIILGMKAKITAQLEAVSVDIQVR